MHCLFPYNLHFLCQKAVIQNVFVKLKHSEPLKGHGFALQKPCIRSQKICVPPKQFEFACKTFAFLHKIFAFPQVMENLGVPLRNIALARKTFHSQRTKKFCERAQSFSKERKSTDMGNFSSYLIFFPIHHVPLGGA